MLEIVLRGQFKKDYKLMEKRNFDMTELESIMFELASPNVLPPKNRDHALLGEYMGYRECHIAYDWLLIYKVVGDQIFFARTGSHSDLF